MSELHPIAEIPVPGSPNWVAIGGSIWIKPAEPMTGGRVCWSFTKFLIGRDGKVARRFEPDTEPDDPELVNAIEKALDAKPAQDAVPVKRKP